MRTLPLHPGARELADDAAVIELGGETLVLTHDAMAQGTHYRADADMADVAWKLVASNLSDLAAKGAEPIGVLLSYVLGADDARFVEGLRQATEELGAPLLGGDTIAASGLRTLGLTAMGRASHTPVPSRSGASAGDAIYVTGMIGCAMLGFEGVAEHVPAFARPRPLLAEGRALAPHVSAMMDVSDGLLLDCQRMAKASAAAFDIAPDAVPVADGSRRNQCLRWGEDYQLLFTAPETTALPVVATRIGSVRTMGGGALLLDGDPVTDDAALGYIHR